MTVFLGDLLPKESQEEGKKQGADAAGKTLMKKTANPETSPYQKAHTTWSQLMVLTKVIRQAKAKRTKAKRPKAKPTQAVQQGGLTSARKRTGQAGYAPPRSLAMYGRSQEEGDDSMNGDRLRQA